MDERPFLFTYAKGGIVRVLTHSEAITQDHELKEAGYIHTATIDAGLWLAYVANNPENVGPRIDEIRGVPTNTTQDNG